MQKEILDDDALNELFGDGEAALSPSLLSRLQEQYTQPEYDVMAIDGEATALRSSLASTQRRVRPRCIVSAGGVLDLAFARSDPRQPQGRRAVESFLSGGDRISDATLNARLARSSPIDLLPPAATLSLIHI